MIRDKTNVPSCDVDDKPTTVTERREGTRRPLSRPTALRPAGPEDVDLSPCKSDLTAARRTHAPSLSVDFAPPSSVDFARPDPRAPLLPTVSRATTQPTLLPIRRYRASPVDTALSKFVRRRNRHCCPSDATEHRCVLQQRSAGLCDDATNAVANPSLRSIACCNSAQQVCATTQPTLLRIRCNGAYCIRSCCNSAQCDCALLQHVAIRCNSASPVAIALIATTQHVAPQRNPMQQSIACCNRVQSRRCTAQHVDAPVVAAQCNGAAYFATV